MLLPRSNWKALHLVWHPLRSFTYQLYFRDILLHFGKLDRVAEGVRHELEECERWHSKRSLSVMTRILNNAHFANSVRSRKIYLFHFELHDATLDFEIGV